MGPILVATNVLTVVCIFLTIIGTTLCKATVACGELLSVSHVVLLLLCHSECRPGAVARGAL